MLASASDEAHDDLDRYICDNDLVVFMSKNCPSCKKAISALEEAGYSPELVEVSKALTPKLIEKTGNAEVPKVWMKGNYVGGCNAGGRGGVLPLLENGKIAELWKRPQFTINHLRR